MNTKTLARGFLVALLTASSGAAIAQTADQPPGKTPGSGATEMKPMPGMGGPGGEHPGRGMMGGGMMHHGMMGGGMMSRGMMGGNMTGGNMMGGCPMMGQLPPGNEKLAMRMHGEIMMAIGNILIKHADSIQSPPSK